MRCRFPFVAASLLGLFFLYSSVFALLPAYHSGKQLIFSEPSLLMLSPHANPALASTLDDYDFNLSWNNQQKNSLYLGFPWLGFGALNTTTGSDYRLLTAWETAHGSSGAAIHWGNGTERTAVAFQYGGIYHPSAQYSLGWSGTIETSGPPGLQCVLDFGFRPTGTDSLTFGTDLALDNARALEYSLYASFRAMPGVWVGARYFNDKTAMIGLSLEFGELEYAHHGGPQSIQSLSYHAVSRASVLHPVLPSGKKYLELKLPSDLPYQRYTWFDNGPTFYDILELIRRAKLNSQIEGISLDLSDCTENGVFLWEIRQALSEFKSTGKKVLIRIERADWMRYYLASVADWIVVDPLGGVGLIGEVWNRTYLKGTLDKVGIGVEELRFFTYKSAYEGFSRERMSTADREQYSTFIQSNYTLVKAGISKARSVSENRFEEWVNTHPWFMAKDALKSGLVDQLGRSEQVKAKWSSWNAGLSPVSAGFLYPKRDTSWGKKPVIAVIYALGVCDMDTGIKARRLAKLLQSLVDNDEIKAIVLRVDSPGGDGMASDLVAEVMLKARDKKPIIVSQGTYAASGGYWLSMNARYIISAPNSLTGSIGVISQWLYNKGIGEWTGVSTDKVKKGDHADLFAGVRLPLINIKIANRNLSYAEKEMWKDEIMAHYQEFVSRVAQGRQKPTANIEAIAQGRVWSGQDAVRLGLADAVGGLDTAITLAKKMASISPDTEVHILQGPSKGMMNLRGLLGIPGGFSEDFDEDLDMLRFKAQFNGKALFMVD